MRQMQMDSQCFSDVKIPVSGVVAVAIGMYVVRVLGAGK